jgi:hypothetical protein
MNFVNRYVVLRGSENWSLLLRQSCRLIKPENKALNKITGLRKKEVVT